MRLIFSPESWSDYLFWQENDKAIRKRINDLIKDVMRSPFAGIGKPEPLLGQFQGLWSRRITREHRLIYRVSGKREAQSIEIVSCRFHYGK